MGKNKDNHADFVHQKTIEILHFLGNKRPNTKQLYVMRQLISYWVMPVSIHFNNQLTATEKTCLLYAAKGFSTEKTANLMQIKATTVRRYRTRIFKKLHCSSIIEAVMKSGVLINVMKIST